MYADMNEKKIDIVYGELIFIIKNFDKYKIDR